MKIFIDAGHNYSGADTGASGNGLKEQDVTFKIASSLKSMFINAGHSVKMSRNAITDNVGNSVASSILERAKMANDWEADLFISIHCNASGKNARGTETLIYGKNSPSYNVAKQMQKSIVKHLGTVDRGVKDRPDLGVLWRTNMPSLLVETAFIDNASDAALLRDKVEDFASAIFQGITGEKEESKVAQTVMKLNNIFVQEIDPVSFRLEICDCNKRSVKRDKYFNAGFFTYESNGKSIPVGNLAIDGVILSHTKYHADWINLAKHKLTTIYTTVDGACGITKTDDLTSIVGLKMAVSGIPIIIGGKRVSLEEIKAEGYFGNELYDTWHGFLGIRHGKLVYVAMKCGFEPMCWALVALGIYDAVKLDGGGSFILQDGDELAGTEENRRINNIGVWM